MLTPILFGPYGSQALVHVDLLRNFGANACWFHGFDGQAFDTCRQFGIEPCVEFKTFRANFNEQPELIPIGVNGKPIRFGELVQGVCLSQEDFLAEIEQDLLEGVRKFEPRGIWLDYLTYAGWFETPNPDLQQSCFCSDCIAEFCEAYRVDAETPMEILGRHPDQWRVHKCQRVAGYAARYAEVIRRQLPGCVVGAYMCPWTPEEFDGALSRIFGQDYDLLAPSIDVFTPLIYTNKSGRSAGWGREFLENASEFVPIDRKVQLILDAKDFPASLIETAESSVPSWGLQMFAGAQVFSDLERATLFRSAVRRIRERLTEENHSN